MFAAYLIGIIGNKRIGQIMLTQFFLDMPFPVGYRAIADTKPNTEDEPAASSYYNANEMQLPGTLPDPAKQVKTDDGEMKQR